MIRLLLLFVSLFALLPEANAQTTNDDGTIYIPPAPPEQPTIREPSITDSPTPPYPATPSPMETNPGTDLPTYEDMNPNTEPVVPPEPPITD